MDKFTEIFVDSRALSVETNIPLLPALKEQGIDIPALCYHSRLGYQGRCSLCVVESYAGGKWEPNHACRLRCEPNLVIRTSSPQIIQIRAWAASMLLNRGPFQEKSIEDMLNNIVGAADGVPLISVPGDSKIQRGCILCARCIQACRQIGKNRLTFLGRGRKLRVGFVDSISDGSSGCGTCRACRHYCPTGYIHASGDTAFNAKLY